jgi:hypothetical protein
VILPCESSVKTKAGLFLRERRIGVLRVCRDVQIAVESHDSGDQLVQLA